MADDEGDKGNDDGKLGYKLLAMGAALFGAALARKILTIGWKAATGKEPPANPEHPDVTWVEATSWAVASGVVVGLVKLVAQRQVAATWQRASGELPPGMEETAA
jgi:pantothenate kinase type III